MSGLNYDVTHECGQINPSGVTIKLRLVCSCDVDVFPDYVTPALQGDKVKLDGDIALLTGKQFITVDMISDTGEIKVEKVGTKGNYSYQNSLEGKMVNAGPEVDEFFQENANGCVVAIVTEKTGAMRVLGNLDSPAWLDAASSTSGSGPETERTWSFTLKDTTGKVAPHYYGVIDLTV